MKLISTNASVTTWIVFMITLMIVNRASAMESAESENTETINPARHLVVTYFYTSFRCPTCHKIEELSAKAVKTNFDKELKSGKVVWQTINVDEPENKHYTNDYQLYSKHLIVSEVKDGEEVRWKDLKDIWTHVRKDEKFDNYVKTEIADWLKE